MMFLASWGADHDLRRRITALFPNRSTWLSGPHVAWTGDPQRDDLVHLTEGVSEQQITITATPTSLTVTTDLLALVPLYWARLGQAWLISNRVEPLTRLIGKTVDPVGAALFMALGWVGDDRTLAEGVRVVPPGVTWSLPGLPPSAPQLPIEPLSTTELAEALIKTVAEIDPVEAPLTAGFDSRLVLALLRAAGKTPHYVTEGPESSADVRIGRELAALVNVPHTVYHPIPPTDEAKRRLVADNDGLVSLAQVSNLMRPPAKGLTLWGMGGEICRAFYHRPDSLLTGRNLIERFVQDRIVCSALTEDAQQIARDYLNRFVQQALDEGWGVRDVPDVFYTRQRVGRWAASNARKAGVPLFAPLATRAWVGAAFGLAARQRWTAPLHYRLLKHLAPDLFAFPVHGGWRPQNPTVALTKATVGNLRRRRPPVALQPLEYGSVLGNIINGPGTALDAANAATISAWESL